MGKSGSVHTYENISILNYTQLSLKIRFMGKFNLQVKENLSLLFRTNEYRESVNLPFGPNIDEDWILVFPEALVR